MLFTISRIEPNGSRIHVHPRLVIFTEVAPVWPRGSIQQIFGIELAGDERG
jgi:hypothetical protein